MENGKAKQFKPIGQLVDFQWRLGVAMKSHNCVNLGTPYVSVLLKVADSDNRVTEYTFEMNLQEFQVRYLVLISYINS